MIEAKSDTSASGSRNTSGPTAEHGLSTGIPMQSQVQESAAKAPQLESNWIWFVSCFASACSGWLCGSGILGRPGRRRTERPRRRPGAACFRSCFRPTPLSLSQQRWSRPEEQHRLVAHHGRTLGDGQRGRRTRQAVLKLYPRVPSRSARSDARYRYGVAGLTPRSFAMSLPV